MTVLAERVGDSDGRRDRSAAPERRGMLFWIRRYLPAEIVGTVVMLLAGLPVVTWGGPAAVAVAAVLGETLGFYAVLAVAVFVEQSRAVPSRRRAAVRTGMLLAAEFGAAEVLDTLLVRPAALLVAVVWIADPVWALLAGKVAADLVFYAMAAGAFLVTAKTGVRAPRRSEESTS